MTSWWLILLSSQAILQHSSVDATFDIGLRWLRGDSSLFSSLINTTATAGTTETTVPQTTPLDVASTTEDALHESRTAVFRDDVVMATTTTDSTTVTTGQTTAATTPAEIDARTAGTTEAMILVEDATPVSLDDLALQVGKVPDPVLHLVVNEDGSHSFVIVSGRRGPTTVPTATTALATTTATETATTSATATTTLATTTSATEATTPATTTSAAEDASTSLFTIAGTTTLAAPNTTSPYLILLHYLRPFIFGRLGAASTASTDATTVVPDEPSTPVFSTGSPWLGGVPDSKPVTTEAADPGLSSPLVPTAAAARTVATADTSTTDTSPVTATSGDAVPATVVFDLSLASYPAEFRATELPYYSATHDTLGYANASFTQNFSTIGEPSVRTTSFDTISTTPVLGTTETLTPTPASSSDYVSTTVATETTAADTMPVTHDSVTSDVPHTDDAATEAPVPTPRFLVSTPISTETTISLTTPVTSNAVTSDVPAAQSGAPPTTEGPTSTSLNTNSPGELHSLASRLITETTSLTPPMIGYLRQVTFAPWPPAAPNKTYGGDGADEPKYRYFYDPAQVMQVL